ncbi:MAG: glycosyltransferase [Streptosporangiales bacterium]|nr:glycosyltransferase [Streptosporangiales bacterium]
MIRAIVYGDVDLNIIDGSAIWAQSMVRALAEAGCEVRLLLKAPVRTDRLTAPLLGAPGVTVVSPHERGMLDGLGDRALHPEQAVTLLTALDAEEPADLVVIRGRRPAGLAAAESALAGRLWTYLTDVPQSIGELTTAARDELTRIARASRLLLCQTEELRCFLEQGVPAACGKSVLFPPVAAVPAGLEAAPPTGDEPLRLAYTGKFAPAWNTLEMTALPDLLAERGVKAELHMVGDKVHGDDPGWARRMRDALQGGAGVTWHGGMSRDDALRASAECHVGLSWRRPEMDASLELSTKVLEFGALGMPVVLNRTTMHERLLGPDYPLFAEPPAGPAGPTGFSVRAVGPAPEDGEPQNTEQAPDTELDGALAALTAAAYPETYALAAKRCRSAAEEFSLDAAAARLRHQLTRAFPDPAPRPLRVVVAGHDLKFFTPLLEHLRSVPGLEVRVDHWHALNAHDEERSAELAAWADVVICEWCGPNALFYSRRKRAGQRLLVRLHRFELYAPWPSRLDISLIDQVICVSPHYARLTRERTGWPEDKITVVPNWVDVDQFDRPKLPAADLTLGLIGMAPRRKRLDLALDTLAELRRGDPRWLLRVKSKLPWDYWWIWKRDEERAYFEEVFRRIRTEPELAGAVVFDPYGQDVAAWLRRVGYVLSPSDDESFHLAPAEGMASGAVPALLRWPGVETIYDERWIHDDPQAMAAALAHTRENDLTEATTTAKTQVRTDYALDDVCTAWTTLVTT